MTTLLDYELSVGTVQNILDEAQDQARTLHQVEDLTPIRVGAHDEIFQSRRPILAGCDVHSTYCYLLADEDHRDETIWGVHLLESSQKGLAPHRIIADGGLGLRAGQKAAWPNTPCDAGVFHAKEKEDRLRICVRTTRAFRDCFKPAIGLGCPYDTPDGFAADC
ncbi:MAG: hypothetical protein HY360_13665 [Verrucomicrobia bacterium]|nr:hypothetical protein [Verrucomicrobiota bacterium]